MCTTQRRANDFSFAADPSIIPSQRLLKILDPVGYMADHRVLASAAPKAVVWASGATRTWIQHELAVVGVVPLVATAIRHLTSSLHPAARPVVALAVVDADHAGEDVLAALSTARWAGFGGRILLVDPNARYIAARALLDAEHVEIAPGALRVAASARTR